MSLPKFFGGVEIFYLLTLEDYQHMKRLPQDKARFIVIDGGIIGSELAFNPSIQGQYVSMPFPEDAIGSLLFPYIH